MTSLLHVIPCLKRSRCHGSRDLALTHGEELSHPLSVSPSYLEWTHPITTSARRLPYRQDGSTNSLGFTIMFFYQTSLLWNELRQVHRSDKLAGKHLLSGARET